MAKRVSLKLPPFNLTKRSTSGKVVHQFIPRGCTHTNRTVIEENVCSSGTGMHHEVWFQDIPPENLPTLHEVYQKQAAEGWKKIRMDMLHAVIESEALPVDQMCSVCMSSTASCRCLQCGPEYFFCVPCYEAAHLKTNIFHQGEVWEVNK